MSLFKKENFDKLVSDLNKLKPDKTAHSDAISEKVNSIETLKAEAEKSKKRKTKYDRLQKVIAIKEQELEEFKKESTAAIQEKTKTYLREFDLFEEKIFKVFHEVDANLSDYILRRIEEEFEVPRLEFELKARKFADAERMQLENSTQHHITKAPRIIAPPTNGEISIVDLTQDKAKLSTFKGKYIVLATRVQTSLKGHEKRETVRTGTRDSFGRKM